MFHEPLQSTGHLKHLHETVRAAVSDDHKGMESHDFPMATCAAPAGSPCRAGRGKVAIRSHTARFRLAPQLAEALSVPAPPYGVGVDRTAPAGEHRRRTGRARPPWLCPRLDRPAVLRRTARLTHGRPG
ncbi:zinc finger domain-containing protein [Streptomyces celluloflavus]